MEQFNIREFLFQATPRMEGIGIVRILTQHKMNVTTQFANLTLLWIHCIFYVVNIKKYKL